MRQERHRRRRPAERLNNKVIIVTGSSTGIGEAIARRVVAEGGRVLVHGRNARLGKAVAASLGRAAALHLDDLTDPAAPERIVKAALVAFGRIDGLVNNAGASTRSNIHTSDADFFDSLMALNLRAPMLMIRAALQALKRSHGAVLNIGSVNAYCGGTNLLVYSMTKGGLMTMTRNLGNALGREGVRVNQINVGWVFTPNEDRLQRSLGRQAGWNRGLPRHVWPSGKIMRPDDVAAAVTYWISDESRPVSGSVVELEQFPIIGRAMPYS